MKAVWDSELAKCFHADGTVKVKGRELRYTVVSEDTILESEPGKPAGSLFSYSYFLKDGAKDRPVLFAYNGGPGSSCLYLHMGFLGPWTAAPSEVDFDLTPPYQAVENQNFLLEYMDIVLVDPVGVGYGRLLDESRSGDFYSIEGDAEAMAEFISAWTRRHGRQQAPKYLFGESYGTIRSIFAAKYLFERRIHLSGMLMMGSCLMEGIFPYQKPIEVNVQQLPSLAAACWYHKRRQQDPQGEHAFIEDAFAFAEGEYLTALYQGAALAPERRSAVIEKLSAFTGLEEDYLRRKYLRIDVFDFNKLLLQEEGKQLSYYDARFTLPAGSDADGRCDAATARMDAMYSALWSGIASEKLGIALDREYLASNSAVRAAFSFLTETDPDARLAAAMARTPQLKLLVMAGRYDLCTTMGMARYALSREWVPQERVCLKEYSAGHMAYVDSAVAAQIHDDILDFFGKERRE